MRLCSLGYSYAFISTDATTVITVAENKYFCKVPVLQLLRKREGQGVRGSGGGKIAKGLPSVTVGMANRMINTV